MSTTSQSSKPSQTKIQTKLKYARDTLHLIKESAHRELQTRGVWTSVHCRIEGNKQTDNVTKTGAASITGWCPGARVTKIYLRAQTRQHLLQRWNDTHPPINEFLIAPSLSIPEEIATEGFQATRVVFQCQTRTAPTDTVPYTTEYHKCPCGQQEESTLHYPQDCPLTQSHHPQITPYELFFDTKNFSILLGFVK